MQRDLFHRFGVNSRIFLELLVYIFFRLNFQFISREIKILNVMPMSGLELTTLRLPVRRSTAELRKQLINETDDIECDSI